MDAQETKDQTGQKVKDIGLHVVAFLDLLGQQDTLRKMTALPNVENQEEVAAFKQKVGEFYKPLYALQTFFNDSIKPFIEESMDETGLLSSDQELLKQFRSTPIFYRHFSDSLIVHIPLRKDIGRFQCRAVYSVLAATALTFLLCMANAWAIRGGIDIGIAMDIEEGEIYGPALVRAHTLESRVAQYPRIVIGEELVRYLQQIAGHNVSTGEAMAHAGFAARSLGLLAVDDDGCVFLDWLGKDIRATFQDTKVVQCAYNFIIQESVRHKENRNSKLGFRYTLLRNYVESRLPDWGLNLQRE